MDRINSIDQFKTDNKFLKSELFIVHHVARRSLVVVGLFRQINFNFFLLSVSELCVDFHTVMTCKLNIYIPLIAHRQDLDQV